MHLICGLLTQSAARSQSMERKPSDQATQTTILVVSRNYGRATSRDSLPLSNSDFSRASWNSRLTTPIRNLHSSLLLYVGSSVALASALLNSTTQVNMYRR